jgi:3-keto-5-aminohexanoate cleavage enzyme
MSYRDYVRGTDVILGVAPNGYRYSQQTNTSLPIDHQKVAEHVEACVEGGATIAHLHGRNQDGESAPAALPRVGQAVRDRCGEDVLVEYAIAPKHPLGDLLDTVAQRPRPDLAAVPLGPTAYGYRGASNVSRRDVDRLLGELADRNVKPNLLVRGGHDVNEVSRIREEGILEGPPLVTVLLGARNGAVATPLVLYALLEALPQSAHCMVRATGPNQFPLTTLALFLGGHVTVGMQDNLFLDRDRPVEHNRQLVDRALDVIDHTQRSVADVEETATELGVRPALADVDHERPETNES